MPTAKVVSASGPPTGAGFSYLVAGLSSRLGRRVLLEALGHRELLWAHALVGHALA